MDYLFSPPRPNRAFLAFVNLIYPITLRIREKVVEMRISPEDWEYLAGLKDKRALLLANHPSLTEPSLIQGVSRRLGESFYYTASSEHFVGAMGWFMQSVGGFSIRQGAPDRESLKMCQEILTERNAKLVILPEGEPGYTNERMLPFNPGAVQTGFWSMEKLAKAAEAEGKSLPSLPIVPLAIHYRHIDDPHGALKNGFTRLEKSVGMENGTSIPLGERATRVARHILQLVEREYGLTSDENADDDVRLAHIFARIEARVSTAIGAELPTMPEHHRRQRALFNDLLDFRDAFHDETTDYGKSADARHHSLFAELKRDMRRYENLLTLDNSVISDLPTTERVAELLIRLEKEVYGGNGRTNPLRVAHVRIAEPIELADWLPQYKKSKRETVADLTHRIEETVQKMLDEMRDLQTPL